MLVNTCPRPVTLSSAQGLLALFVPHTQPLHPPVLGRLTSVIS